MKRCFVISLLTLALGLTAGAQILTVGNSLGVSQRPWLARDFPAIPASAWIGGLSFDSLTCQMVLTQLPALLAWEKQQYPQVQVIVNFTGEDDAAHSVPIPTFVGCVQATLALERQTWPQATLVLANVIPFPPYRLGWNVSYLAPMLVDGYNTALAGLRPVNLWQVAAVPPYYQGNPTYWSYPNSDPNGTAWAAFDQALQPIIYAAYGAR